ARRRGAGSPPSRAGSRSPSRPAISRGLSPHGSEDKLRMVAGENLEEWTSSVWVELETIRAVIDAYGKGLIGLPEVPEKTKKGCIRHVPQTSGDHPYTRASVAAFLGWTRKNGDGFVQPDYPCEVAFKALDAVEQGLVRSADRRDLRRRPQDGGQA